MSPVSTVTAQWLALRAAADDSARSRELAAELSRRLPPGDVTVHDLGSGTGAMASWLAPHLSGPQRWVLHDGDAGILAHADLRGVTDADGRPVAVDSSVEDLADLAPDALAGATAVTASALLDVITGDEAERIVAGCLAARAPALFSLTVTGSVRLDPSDRLDSVLGAAFNAHQRREAAARRLLGPDAAGVVAGLFTAAGWGIRVAETPWLLGPPDSALIHAWLDGWVDAAIEHDPGLADAAAGYRHRRHDDTAAGILRVTVGHRDLLAWPQ